MSSYDRLIETPKIRMMNLKQKELKRIRKIIERDLNFSRGISKTKEDLLINYEKLLSLIVKSNLNIDRQLKELENVRQHMDNGNLTEGMNMIVLGLNQVDLITNFDDKIIL